LPGIAEEKAVEGRYLQGYLDFLSLLLNERGRWFALFSSDYLMT
jgi:hypothetical protein